MKFYRFEIFTRHPDKKDGDISFEYGENLEEIRKNRENVIKHSGPNVVIGSIQEANYAWSDLEGERCWGTRGQATKEKNT